MKCSICLSVCTYVCNQISREIPRNPNTFFICIYRDLKKTHFIKQTRLKSKFPSSMYRHYWYECILICSLALTYLRDIVYQTKRVTM